MSKQIISTSQAPAAIGTYSQATRHGNTAYLSGQIPLDPTSMEIVAGGSLNDILKLNVFLTDMGSFTAVNAIMAEYFTEPYPARAAIGVAALPRDAQVEMDAILGL